MSFLHDSPSCWLLKIILCPLIQHGRVQAPGKSHYGGKLSFQSPSSSNGHENGLCGHCGEPHTMFSSNGRANGSHGHCREPHTMWGGGEGNTADPWTMQGLRVTTPHTVENLCILHSQPSVSEVPLYSQFHTHRFNQKQIMRYCSIHYRKKKKKSM